MENNRVIKIKELRLSGWSWRAIGVYFNISTARAHQIGSGYKPDQKRSDKVLFRDECKCQYPLCDGIGDALIVHHLDHNPRNNDLDNLITMHGRCHTKYHMSFGNLTETGHQKNTKLHKCLGCDKQIILSKKTCDRECQKKYIYNKRKRICKMCGKEYKVMNYVRKTFYCGQECNGKRLAFQRHNIKKS